MINQEIEPSQLLTDHFMCPDGIVDISVMDELTGQAGYFRFGRDAICYGQCSSGVTAKSVTDCLHDALDYVCISGSSVRLPFDPVQVVNNIRHERYVWNPSQSKIATSANGLARRLYYLARPLMSVAVRKHLQRQFYRGWNDIPFPSWPVDLTVENIFEQLLMLSMKSQNVARIPFIWFWPDAASSCCIVTHDVETKAGRDFCAQLMDLDESFGIKSAIQIVPKERYSVSQSLLDCIRERGCELNVHDLNHDGMLMANRDEFLRRAIEINLYGKRFGAVGFRSAVLYRNIDWYDALDFSYDMSVPNVAHLDPQRGGCCTVFPFFNGNILELPVTMVQDYSLFHILKDYTIGVWKEQISIILEKHGLMQMIVHPDYTIDKEARRVYADLLCYLSELRAQGETWIALPSEVAAWWRLRQRLSLVSDGRSWHIEGNGKDRARIAYATITDGKLVYELEPTSEGTMCHAPS